LFETEIFNQENQLICRANVELIFVNKRSGKVMNCPEDLNIKLSQFR
jgi:acyl-CoA thioesterase FadM